MKGRFTPVLLVIIDVRNMDGTVSHTFKSFDFFPLERLAEEPDHLVDLGSDQTSLHNPFLGGYYPVGLTIEQSNIMMTKEPNKFKALVQESLRRQIAAIDKLCARGMYFWDYGNAFLVECQRAGASVLRENAPDDKTFRYPSYMQDIMGWDLIG
uniref:Urocanase domain-containing protein n=1 Tax=Heterorhabditis bacteriophora TaxID=37862 RepID=A0A1I7XSF7_HETBA